MNLLVFTSGVWDNSNAFGNTVSNFFEGNAFKDDEFYNIYMRKSMPNNTVCKNYYRMTLVDILKHNFNKEKIGENIIINNNNNNIEKKNEYNNEQKYIDAIHKYSLNIVYALAEKVYRKKKWLNKNLKDYINKANPDVFFSFFTNVAILKPLIEHIKSNTNAKIVLFIADDVYDSYKKKSVFRRNKLLKEFKDIINNADKVYAISKELCEEYSKLFNKEIDILYKGCSFDYPVKEKINDTIKFVYAGNLFYGRDEILSKIGQAIENNNKTNKQKAILEIYTGTTITDELNQKLNIGNSSVIMGKKDYNEIKKIMNDAEFNLQIESFDPKHIDYVKYSFSTKIIDCIQAGSSVVAVGPDSISSIKYMKNVPGVTVINNLDNIDKEINKLINSKDRILETSKSIRNYALKRHDIENNQLRLREDLINLKRNSNDSI